MRRWRCEARRESRGEQLLEAGVLVLERLQPTRVRHVNPAILRPELMEGRRGDAVLAADRRRRSSLLFLQHPDDLLFPEPRGAHRPSP